MWEGKKVVVGVTGSIAAFKACELVSRLTQAGAEVHVVLTRAATNLVAPATFRELSRHPVCVDLFAELAGRPVAHVSLAEAADVVVVAPATANVLGKVAAGVADDFLTTTIIATRAPVLFAPAMNVRMWQNPVVQANVERLKGVGYHFVGPATGWLACGETGEGRLAPVEEILTAAGRLLKAADLAGRRVLITAGPTREPLDPVRFISNRSSGRMGYALAEAARRRGAEVELVSGPVALAPPPGVRVTQVETAGEMRQATLELAAAADAVVLAAAVADYRPAEPAPHKLKRTADEAVVRLVANPDIAREVGSARRPGQVLVGFAAETEDLLRNAEAKRRAKGLDLIVANLVGMAGSGFDAETNSVIILGPEGPVAELEQRPKSEVAERIWDAVVERWTGGENLGRAT
ncbi:MAG: bifunctional phosphopantothenoylcysteine decarboxylase/phosphopantothenate--cysteine ligase CoaBC [Bacillota bacterium]|nr:bifunctional phosphopantothenoylcysteine decarboxylase/phosphopantothenate--cysteine ligase CoaBC [Bacillota bacterium]